MPQMSPIWWTSLFMMFNLSLMMMLIMMYFQVELKPDTQKKLIKGYNQYNWKW